MKEFEQYLQKNFGKTADTATVEEVLEYMKKLEIEDFPFYHFSIVYYYWSTFDQLKVVEMRKLNSERTGKDRRIFQLKKFAGIDKENVKLLNEVGIFTVEDMHLEANTQEKRKKLATKTGLPSDRILKLTKLSDLTRTPGLKGTRSLL